MKIYKDCRLKLPFYKEGHHFIKMFFLTDGTRVPGRIIRGVKVNYFYYPLHNYGKSQFFNQL